MYAQFSGSANTLLHDTSYGLFQLLETHRFDCEMKENVHLKLDMKQKICPDIF